LQTGTDLESWITVAEAIGSTAFVLVVENPAGILHQSGDHLELRLPVDSATPTFLRLEIETNE
jgi:hypothetical protein